MSPILFLEYNALIMSVTSREEHFSVSKVSLLLLTNEKLLEQQAQMNEIFTANLALGTASTEQQKKMSSNFNNQKVFNNSSQRN